MGHAGTQQLLDVRDGRIFIAYGKVDQVSPLPKAHLLGGGCITRLPDINGTVSDQWFSL